MMLDSYAGGILRIDLTSKRIRREPLKEEFARSCIGGVGLGARLLFDEVPSWASAYDSSNLLIFAPGALTGTPVPCTSRFFVITKSPLTSCFADSAAGGFWGPELKFAGYDAVAVSGRASSPVYLWIHDEEVEIKDARSYWGMNARDADKVIRKDLGDNMIRVVDIGQGGENLVLYAAVMSDEAGRAAARCGVGSVMGFKNLKAIAVRGHRRIPVHDADSIRDYSQQLARRFAKDEQTKHFRKYSSPGYFAGAVETGDASIRNWRGGEFNTERISYPGGYDKVLAGRATCYNCPHACRTKVTTAEGPYKVDAKVEGLEYETLAAFGSNCGVDDINALVKANDLCNTLGIDTISVGASIAFAMECYENGILSDKDTDGVKLRFGNSAALVEMVEHIGLRMGFGNVLAEGVARAAQMIGGGAEKYAFHVKRMEVPMHDPRSFKGFCLNYACSPVGADHMEGELFAEAFYSPLLADVYSQLGLKLDRLSSEKIAEGVVKIQNLWHVVGNAMGYCLFACLAGCTDYPLEFNIKFFGFATGWNASLGEILKTGERIFALKKAFNVKHGILRNEDLLPRRFLTEPAKIGPSRGETPRLNELMNHYYRLRGWDGETGKPTREKLTELGLQDIIDEIYPAASEQDAV